MALDRWNKCGNKNDFEGHWQELGIPNTRMWEAIVHVLSTSLSNEIPEERRKETPRTWFDICTYFVSEVSHETDLFDVNCTTGEAQLTFHLSLRWSSLQPRFTSTVPYVKKRFGVERTIWCMSVAILDTWMSQVNVRAWATKAGALVT